MRSAGETAAGISVPPCPPIGWSSRARPREQAKLAGGAEDEEHPYVTEAQFWNLRDRYRYRQLSGDQIRVLVLRPEGQRRSLRFADTPINVAAAIMLGCGDSRSVFHRCICERPR
jgi:hypothetical protein